MNRLALSAATIGIAMMMGCSSPSDTSTEQSTDTTESALDAVRCDVNVDVNSDCDGPGPMAYTLTSLDGETLTGVNGFGQTINATFGSNTKFRLANLNRFTPGEPVFPLLQAYNAAVQSNTGVVSAIGALYQSEGGSVIHARLSVKSGSSTVFAFRPVP